ncbi:hypothetical protein RU820_06135 [Acidithiobacillus ferrooxidans]|uniref:Uncharacterized protein n=1 Tax=Acidithiobacillus ferrooxidans (strain ATCC 23270 / DSM 14882 / CIP 104768 / NCIMB 8455) TaxID=243159 RepID=B7J8X0_ACIF2|nr:MULTISPECIES: hypothetical protein [Acidithiobacillus]ACK79415.1 hypothetical protein AFE_1288 [Acidithiobacillus ferrooxidans ATCC 23270]MBN6744332.1 hypothetical protein [Acidithiobacillus sp. MC2.2]MBN6747291.1 hypothetical protein [Acidithiobacillus sp. PG05]
MLTAEIDVLQDPNSPHMKIWVLLVAGEHAWIMFGGVAGSIRGRSTYAVTPKEGRNKLATKIHKYPSHWNRSILMDDQVYPSLEGAMDAVMQEVADNFVINGGNDWGIDALLNERRVTPLRPIPQPSIPQPPDHSRLEAALESISANAPWAF